MAWMSVVPPFSSGWMPIPVRAAVSFAVGLAVGNRLSLRAVPTWQGLIADVVGQIFIGAAFGAVTMILLSMFSAAGNVIGLFGGLMLPQQLTPDRSSTNSLGTLYQFTAFALLVSTGGDLLLLRGLVTSFQLFGPSLATLPVFAGGASTAVATMFTATLEIVGPIVAVELLVQVALGLLAKSAPNINIFLFMFSVQVFVLVMVLALAVPALPDAVERLVERALNTEGGMLR